MLHRIGLIFFIVKGGTLMKKKKILYVVEAMGGGVFTYIVDLANELVNTHDMYIAYAIRSQTPADFKNYFDKRVHLIEVKNFTREINLVKDVKTLKEIWSIASKVKPDIIHLHSSKAGVIGRIAYTGRKTPLFYTPHGYSFLMEDCNRVKRLAFKMIEKVVALRRCTTISCSVGEHKETLKLTKRAVYVNNGINTEKLSNMIETIEKKQHPFTVYTLGRICYQKNPTLFNRVAESMPDVCFLWIGDGELREELTAPNITVTGWVDRATALQFTTNADAFLLTSLWEGLPISLLESMYMKKVCIVSDVIGNRDVIHTGQNGVVCQNIEEFVKAIKTIQDSDTALRYIEAAYADILNEYCTEVMAKKYMKIYEKSLKK